MMPRSQAIVNPASLRMRLRGDLPNLRALVMIGPGRSVHEPCFFALSVRSRSSKRGMFW